MSVQWMLVAGFLYFEVAFVAFLCLPILSATRWSRIFNSRLLGWLSAHGNYYFGILVVVLLILFADALNQMNKHGQDVEGTDHSAATNIGTQAFHAMKKFRAQRNFYISGFALLLIVVLRRMISVTCLQATMEAKLNAALQQAKSASDQAERSMDEAEKLKKAARGEVNNEEGEKKGKLEERNKALINELNETQRGKEKAQTEMEALQKQAEGVSKEYDRLLAEHSKLQEKVKELEGHDGDDKKDQ